MSDPGEAAKQYRVARERLADEAVQRMVQYLRGADAAIASQKDLSAGIERLTETLLAEGWV
jgi:nitrogenase molybdenum-iron protein alpha/beta subunit